MTYVILVIDDEQPIRESLELLLSIKGYRVATACDGREGLEAIESVRPQLVITDIVMPGTDGIEAIVEIKARDPAVKVIAMSGGGSIDGRDCLAVAGELGVDACIDKPFRAEVLLEAIERCRAEAVCG